MAAELDGNTEGGGAIRLTSMRVKRTERRNRTPGRGRLDFRTESAN